MPSVQLRFEITAEVTEEANILNSETYPAIRDDTISFVIPYRLDEDFRERRRHLKRALAKSEWAVGRKLVINHPLNGDFFVLSFAL